jgi:cell wall-associated NlpC family hydrolase
MRIAVTISCLALCALVLFTSSCSSSRKSTPTTKATITHKNKAKISDDVQKLCTNFELNTANIQSPQLYQLIYEWLGVPHKDNGCEKSGTDCSCFVKMLYSTVYNTDIGKHTKEMFERTNRIQKSELQEGDLVFFTTKGKSISHVGVYLQQQKFVHVSTKKGVHINSLQEDYYIKTYTGAGRRPKP